MCEKKITFARLLSFTISTRRYLKRFRLKHILHRIELQKTFGYSMFVFSCFVRFKTRNVVNYNFISIVAVLTLLPDLYIFTRVQCVILLQ